MPHFIIDCSAAVLDLHAPENIIGEVYDTADSTGLFGAGDIKVRINAYAMFTVGGTDADFIHVFGHIMQGRTTEQKKDLSDKFKICNPQKIEVIPLGFDLSRFSEKTEEKRISFRTLFDIPENKMAIGIIGRLSEIKNHSLFLRAISELKKRDQNVLGIIIGDGSMMNELTTISKIPNTYNPYRSMVSAGVSTDQITWPIGCQ